MAIPKTGDERFVVAYSKVIFTIDAATATQVATYTNSGATINKVFYADYIDNGNLIAGVFDDNSGAPSKRAFSAVPVAGGSD